MSVQVSANGGEGGVVDSESVSAPKLSRLFTRFEQADSSATRNTAAPAWAWLSRKLVELMGGTISVGSTLGVGSNFWFTVGHPWRELGSQVAPWGDHSVGRDEHQAVRRMWAAALSGLNAEVTGASSLSEAFTLRL